MIRIKNVPDTSAPKHYFSFTSLTQTFALFSSFLSLQHIDFPTQTLAKSCKPIPIIIIGFLVFKRRYSMRKIILVLFIIAGITTFILDQEVEGSKHHQTFNMKGILLTLLSLTLDGFTGPTQDALIKKFKPSPYRTMFYSSLWSALYTLLISLYSGEFLKAIEFISLYPTILLNLILLALASPLGQFFIYQMIHDFGSLTTSIITTTRKFFSIIISIFWFGHELSLIQWICVFVVFISLGFDLLDSKRVQDSEEKIQQLKTK